MKLEAPAELLRFKRGVDRSDIHPLLWAWLGTISAFHYGLTLEPATVTSLRRPYNPSSSTKHATPDPPEGEARELVTAADLRRHALDRLDRGDPSRKWAERFCKAIQASAGDRIGVVLEPEWLTVRQLEQRFGIRIYTRDQELAARRRVGPHIHLQLKGRLWIPAGNGA